MTSEQPAVLRTPESAFTGLEDFPFEPRYSEVDGGELGPLRMAHIDAGQGPVILCLHGEPSWSYLYRKMVPVLAAGGCRVLAPDLVGFGRSDKPDAFRAWRRFSLEDGVFDTGFICNEFGSGGLSADEIEAFRAPFPDDRYKAGARAFPSLVPDDPSNPASAANREAWEVLRGWDKPALMCFSDGDAITRGGERVFISQVPGCADQPHITLSGGHFIQNHDGERWARAILDWMSA